MKALISIVLLLVSFASLAQTKGAVSSLSVTTGTITSSTAVTDGQDSITVYGTWAKWKTPKGTFATPVKNAVLRVTMDSTKTYKNLFLNVTGSARIQVSTSTDNTTYTVIKRGFISGTASGGLWRRVPINRSARYVRITFLTVGRRFKFNELAVSK